LPLDIRSRGVEVQSRVVHQLNIALFNFVRCDSLGGERFSDGRESCLLSVFNSDWCM
jgi:hypothetical protein